MAAPDRRVRRGGSRGDPRRAPADAALGREQRAARHLEARGARARAREPLLGLRPCGPAVPALRHAGARTRPGRRQPQDVLVPAVPDVTRPGHLPPLKRVGHKGAAHVTPGNTLESFQAALDLRVDMIEFDVLRTRAGELVLAHDYEDAESRTPPTLEEGLDHFAGEAYADTELDVDLKLPGYERAVVDGIRERGLADRALISSQYLESLELIGRVAPEIRRGWSVPRVRRDWTRSPFA